ncbi:vWA domain-containing protein [Amycolatopsis magusensis]|uniref:vWA domain-containing protein n=1 Tax=Amycolatopsis magusensis TaxID=882444 RepID=UPI003C2C0C40
MGFDVLPCYVVCDISSSMIDHIEDLNAGLREFRGAVHADRAVAAGVRVCVVGFADVPRVLQPLGPAINLVELTGPGSDGGSDFGLAFTLLRDTIDRDVRRLRAQRLRIRRPLVFFTSDGRPTDAHWPAVFAELTDPAWATHPEVIAFGIGAADPVILGRIGTSRVFLGRDGVRMGTALTASVVRAERARTHG